MNLDFCQLEENGQWTHWHTFIALWRNPSLIFNADFWKGVYFQREKVSYYISRINDFFNEETQRNIMCKHELKFIRDGCKQYEHLMNESEKKQYNKFIDTLIQMKEQEQQLKQIEAAARIIKIRTQLEDLNYTDGIEKISKVENQIEKLKKLYDYQELKKHIIKLKFEHYLHSICPDNATIESVTRYVDQNTCELQALNHNDAFFKEIDQIILDSYKGLYETIFNKRFLDAISQFKIISGDNELLDALIRSVNIFVFNYYATECRLSRGHSNEGLKAFFDSPNQSNQSVFKHEDTYLHNKV